MDGRVLDLLPRLEDTRERQIPQILKFELDEIKAHFDEDLSAISSLFTVYKQNEKNDICAKLILRSQVVLLESAFDFYLHEITKFGVNKIFEGAWISTEKYKNIIMRLEIVEKIINDEVSENWFFEFINQYYAKETMVSFESIKDQMNLLGIKIQDIADKAFYEQGSSEPTIMKMKNVVNALYKRRNIIAHQSNRGHEDATYYPISKDQVDKFIVDIEKIVNAIHEVAIQHE